MPIQGNFYKYLNVDNARGMERVLAGCVADTKKPFHGVSRHLPCPTCINLCPRMLFASPACKPVPVTVVMQHVKLGSKAWRLIRCYIFMSKKLQYLKSEKYPQCSPGRHRVPQPNQQNGETRE